MSAPPDRRRALARGAWLAASMALAGAIAAQAPNGDFPRIFLYVVCTFAVCACATVAAIRVLGWAFASRLGIVEFGLLIGLFVIAPAALAGAFQILEAVVGPL